MPTVAGVLFTPNEGELDIGEALSSMPLELWLATSIEGGYSEATVLADVVEPSTDGTGYGRRTLAAGSATTTPGDPTATEYPPAAEWVLAETVDPITHLVIVNPDTQRIRHVVPLAEPFVPDGETPLTVPARWTQS